MSDLMQQIIFDITNQLVDLKDELKLEKIARNKAETEAEKMQNDYEAQLADLKGKLKIKVQVLKF